MTRRNLSEEWRLEEAENTDEQWKLQPAEQNALVPWLLQEQGQQPAEADWQPVEYTRERRSGGGGNWILPTLIGVALVAVVSYAAWIGLQRAGLLDVTTVTGEPTVEAVALATAEPPVVSAAPTNTLPPPTATLEPTPTTLPTAVATTPPPVLMEYIVVNTVGGVNARRAPGLEGELIQIVPESETRYLVAEDRGEWVQIVLPDGQLGWVANEFVQRAGETVPFDEANRRRAAAGLPPLTGVSAPAGIASTTAPTTTTALPTPAAVAPPALSVTIIITAGLNARETPSLDGAVLQLLPPNTTYPALARTADSQWVQVLLPDSRLAWLSAQTQFITASGDLNTLSTEPATVELLTTAQPAATTPLTTTPAVTATTGLSPTVTQVVSGATASVVDLRGASARAEPNRDLEALQVLPFDSVVPIVGRSADSQWIQVTLEEGRLAWVLVNAVQVSVDVATLPVVAP
jgi:uncharacterized protein YgiM (DUF1202 family)